MKHKRGKNKKKVIIIIGIIIILIAIFITYQQFFSDKSSSSSGTTQQVKIVPLSPEEKQKIAQTVLSSEFIKDVPKKYPIALRFFSFESGQKIWHDGFLIGRDQFLSSGEPEIYLSLHSKYISELNNDNLCEVIKRANTNGDLDFQSDSSKASLLWKYKGMLGHRECFGF